MEGATVEVIDNNGNVKDVKPVDLVKGETLATFDFVSPLGTNPEGVWKVNGVVYDFGFLELLNDVNTATGELELYNALIAIGAKNVLSENAVAYDTANPKDFTSLEEIQKFVDKVNQAEADKGEFDDWKDDAVKAHGNNVQLLSELDRFDRVNPKYLSDYKTALFDAGPVVKPTLVNFDDVQDAIDGVNSGKASTAVGDAEAANAGGNRDAYNAAVTAVSFVAPDEEDDDTKAKLEERLNIVDKVLRVFEAKTAAQFTVAYNALVSAVDDETVIGEDPYYEAARQDYIDELDKTAVVTPATVKAAIVDGNKEAQANALGDIDSISDIAPVTSTADVLKYLKALDAVTEKDAFDIADVKTDKNSLEAYRTKLAGITWDTGATETTKVVENITKVEQAIDSVNNPSGAGILDDVQAIVQGTNIATSSDELWDGTANSSNNGLKDLPAQFNAKKANKAAYFANITEFDAILDGSADDAQEALAINLIKAINSLEDLKAAKTATEGRAALSALAFNSYVTGATELNVG